MLQFLAGCVVGGLGVYYLPKLKAWMTTEKASVVTTVKTEEQKLKDKL